MTAISVFAMLTYLVLYIQNALGYSALETGLRLFPLTVASFFFAAIAGRLANRVPLRLLIATGLVLAGIGLLLSRAVEPGGDWTALLLGGVFIGAGAGTVNPSVAAAALGAAPVAKSGMASGLNSTFRLLGRRCRRRGPRGAAREPRLRSSSPSSLPQAPEQAAEVVATGNIEAAAAAAPAFAQENAAEAAEAAFIYGLDTIFLAAAIVAFVGAALALALVRQSDITSGQEAPPAAG